MLGQGNIHGHGATTEAWKASAPGWRIIRLGAQTSGGGSLLTSMVHFLPTPPDMLTEATSGPVTADDDFLVHIVLSSRGPVRALRICFWIITGWQNGRLGSRHGLAFCEMCHEPVGLRLTKAVLLFTRRGIDGTQAVDPAFRLLRRRDEGQRTRMYTGHT